MNTPLFPLHVICLPGKPGVAGAYRLVDKNRKTAALGDVIFQMPVGDPANRRLVETVAKICNAAYEQGIEDNRTEARKAILGILGIKE